MNKLYSVLFILLISSGLYSQVAIRAVELPDSRFQFINKTTGQKVNDLVWDETESFVNGFAKVASKHKWGFVDKLGNPVINTSFDAVRNFVNKLAAAQQNSKWGFVDENGATIIPFEYDIVYDFKEKVTAAYKNNKWFLIDRQGNITKALDVDIFWGFKNGKAKITRQGLSGVMNINGDVVSMEVKKGQSKPTDPTAARPGSVQGQGLPCPDNIGFERGDFTNWSCYTGNVVANGTTNVITVNPSPPTPNRHVIYPRTNPSALDPYGLFPINPPDGSGYAFKLGNNINGAEAERVRYQIDVPANAADYSITYRYAVVFQDPGHFRYQQPRFSVRLLDIAANKYLPCASYEYVADDTIPGFFSSPVDDTIKCKTWAPVFINLSAYAGKSLMLEFTTADCTRGAHWGYAYVDVGDCNITADIQYQCNPDLAKLTAPPGFKLYRWWDENYTTMLGPTQKLTLNPAPPANTVLHVEVIPLNGLGCSDTLHVTTVNRTPSADAGPDKVIVCDGSAVRLGTTSLGGLSYSWAPATYLSNPNIARPLCTPLVTTTYKLTVTNNATGCIDEDSVTVTVIPKPTALFDPSPDQCLTDNNFTFTNNSILASIYDWRFGDGDSSVVADPAHSYAKAQTFTVKLLVTASNGCQDSVTHDVIVHPNPFVKTIVDTSICRGKSVRLITNGALVYEWTPVNDLNCTDCAAPVADPLTNATYFVKGTNSFGCPGYDTVAINVYQPIQINVSPDAVICAKQSVNLLASGAASYAWWPAQSLNNATIADPVATPAVTTKYRVIGFDGHSCFTDTAYVNITVNPIPTIELGPDLLLPTGTIHPFNPVTTKGPIVSWQWTPPTNLNCADCPDPSATIKNDITYHVSIENVYGCINSDSVNIKTFCEGSQVFIPNAFTPDGDGVNDILMVRAKGIDVVRSLRIFTRWGELVFEKTNFPPNSPAYGWDGKIRGVTAPAEVYVYTAEVTCDNLQTFTYKGNISILK
ncbi:MAG: WG repeat-containing protein [Chitinophagaceae bacterium]